MTFASSGNANFNTTRWSLVVAAAKSPSPQARAALEELCGSYWYAVYAFVRRRGQQVEDARDLTQEFFARLLEKDYLEAVDRERGRFRTFLLTAVSHFLSNERERACAQKRGGGQTVLSLDFESGEERYQHEPADHWTAEKIFDRRWALTLLDQAVAALKQEYAEADKSPFFEELKVYLTGDSGAPIYENAAAKLEMSPGAVKVTVHRLRQKYRETLRQLIAQTVAAEEDIDNELQVLLTALRGD
ncbi:MAG: sigma-70 family RNA polymerase sigma factor [Planctomycetales bacterium]|nr:sigma-70 family RNA polymerase sigma factor [Planctomycetales bacterium]